MVQSRADAQPPRIVFNIPDGREELNPSPESLRELVLSRGDEFWAAGSGQAALEFKGSAAGSRLLLMALQDEGFFLIFEPLEGDSLASLNPSSAADDKQVTVYVGGEPMEVPQQYFLDKESAWRVIGDFLNDGKPSPRIKWEPWL